jgi:hypothetical protein
MRAFCLGRPGAGFHQVGPVVAETPAEGIAVLAAASESLSGRPVQVDVVEPADPALAQWLRDAGLVEARSLVRMVRGAAPAPAKPGSYLAAAGPELG